MMKCLWVICQRCHARKKGNAGFFVWSHIQFSLHPRKYREVAAPNEVALPSVVIGCHSTSAPRCTTRCFFFARIGWKEGLEGPQGQIGHRPITFLAGAESLVLHFLLLSHGNSCKFLLAVGSRRKWFGMHHNKPARNITSAVLSVLNLKDAAFVKRGVRTITNHFLGFLSIATFSTLLWRDIKFLLPATVYAPLWPAAVNTKFKSQRAPFTSSNWSKKSLVQCFPAVFFC